MLEIVLSLALFVVAGSCLWAANRLASPNLAAAGAGRTAAGRRIARVPVLLTAVLVYWGLAALLARPWSVFGICMGGIVLLFAGNALKVKLLGEVLLFSDVFLAGHALRFPRLYFGYVPAWVWGVLTVVAIALVAVIAQESTSEPLRVFAAVVFCLGLIGTVLSLRCAFGRARALLRLYRPAYRAQADAARFTPIGSALLHVLGYRTQAERIRRRFDLNNAPGRQSAARPQREAATQPPRHVVLIQAESFCPVSEILSRQSTTPTLDRMRAQDSSGKLLLDWRGAYTMRTEFCVLTGLSTQELGAYAFDPYQLARRIPMDSLARDLKAIGYESIAWHPNDGRFFDRFAVMPHLGFSCLMDGSAFADLPRVGHYTGDEALLDRAARFLATRTQPTFLFVVTIEAHGPWSGNAQAQLREYEEHLANLDAGVRKLVSALEKTNPGSIVALYGDHLPSLTAFAKAPAASAWFAHVCGRTDSALMREDLPAHGLRAAVMRLVRASAQKPQD